jgi:hypothetical protein
VIATLSTPPLRATVSVLGNGYNSLSIHAL